MKDINQMTVADFILMAGQTNDPAIARAKMIQKGREVDPEEVDEERVFFNGVWAFQAELQARGNHLN